MRGTNKFSFIIRRERKS